MIHFPYFDEILSFAIRGLRVTTTPGGTLPLFTENPRRGVLGNRAAEKRASRKLRFVLCSAARTVQFLDYTGLSMRTMGTLQPPAVPIPIVFKTLKAYGGRLGPPYAGGL